MEDVADFVFITYNIDSSSCDVEKRLESFINLIKNDKPDILAIQEVKREVYEKITREMKHLGYKYRLPSIVQKRDVGELIFSKYPIESFEFVPFKKTKERRGLNIAKIDLWEKHMHIITTQLESVTAIRNMQIKEAQKIIKNIKGCVIFGGDMRIMSYEKSLNVPPEWSDAWYDAGSSLSEFTVNHDTNLLVSQLFKDRPDRVWSILLDPIEYDLCGIDADPAISSHYGVKVKFEFI